MALIREYVQRFQDPGLQTVGSNLWSSATNPKGKSNDQPPKIILMAAEEKRARTLSSDPGIDDGG